LFATLDKKLGSSTYDSPYLIKKKEMISADYNYDNNITPLPCKRKSETEKDQRDEQDEEEDDDYPQGEDNSGERWTQQHLNQDYSILYNKQNNFLSRQELGNKENTYTAAFASVTSTYIPEYSNHTKMDCYNDSSYIKVEVEEDDENKENQNTNSPKQSPASSRGGASPTFGLEHKLQPFPKRIRKNETPVILIHCE